jgi:uncharacterized protein YcbK (DUF882 family)
MPGRIVITTLLVAGAMTGPFGVPLVGGSAGPDAAAVNRKMTVEDDTLLGRSGKLRARFLPMREARAFADRLQARRAEPGASALASRIASIHVLPVIPFLFKVDGWMGMYRMGYWPGEQRAEGALYGLPSGFIEVTPGNRDLPVSEHFRLRDFLTKDQEHVWPKYLVLRESLLDKLELVMDELRLMGYPVQRLQVMSGFRHPFYNALGVGAGGRARESRHQYGDAADVFVDNDGDGRMDDLDGDGHATVMDADLIILAVERVEMAHPELTGGIGRYYATHAHGPFVHVDVRGTAARWGGA